MWGNKIHTVGTISDFIKAGSIGVAPSTPLQFQFADWLIHPIQKIKDVGADAAYNAIHPFVDLLVAVTYPVANLLILTAGIVYIINKDRGITLLTKTSVVYLLVNMLPMLVKAFFQMVAI
ncbi:hypothetical protein [Peribacillus simplex]|uniref:Uncharacterized protein n=1 Tax=Peribacillus simplex TaxID=1478 RepID=A0AAN2TS00_9BACI|nr:hypothetical protein [Peribacillus simplex]CEG31466.1 hypothetical protein BN1180_01610 [Peribacillus simplex]